MNFLFTYKTPLMPLRTSNIRSLEIEALNEEAAFLSRALLNVEQVLSFQAFHILPGYKIVVLF
jgi:hypothetical protein